MEKEVEAVYNVIKDYRKEEGLEISKMRITKWINQFPREDRIFILKELKYIFGKMYFSRDRIKNFIKQIIQALDEKFGYSDFNKLFDNTNFLDLQNKGKSQKEILELLHETLKSDYDYDCKNLACCSSKHNVYIDDVLCTGNTFYNNLKDWATENRLAKLRSKEIDLSVFYLFISKKHYDKKRGQFYHNVSEDFADLIHIEAIHLFNDNILKPVDENIPDVVCEYMQKVDSQANKYAKNKGFDPYELGFYRKEINPEKFYSSIENRKRLELIFLKKGIEILTNSNVLKSNIRPLGYSLPSYKDFGFGALIFTWRNVPNNTPLVFWYDSKGFIPLFQKRSI